MDWCVVSSVPSSLSSVSRLRKNDMSWHFVWVGALAALAVDVLRAALKKFNVSVPGLS